MERVEFEQEQILAELKDLEEKGLFSKVRYHNTSPKRFHSSEIGRDACHYEAEDIVRNCAYPTNTHESGLP